ncbi:MAG: hypothetical protein AAF658_01530, partial [Myxococcota bacterium]
GKPGYLAPEMLRLEEFSREADYFSLGVTIHECLSGRTLFNELDDLIALRDGSLESVPPPSVIRDDVPPALERLIIRLMNPDPSARLTDPQTIREELFALPPDAAPYPDGPLQVADAIKQSEATLKSRREAPLEVDQTADTVALGPNDIPTGADV